MHKGKVKEKSIITELPHKIKFLQVLLNSISRNETRKTICQLLNIKNQTLSYHVSKLRTQGIIEVIVERPATYKLTSLGEHVREMTTLSDNTLRDFYKCHHKIVGFRIEDFGSWQFNSKIWKTMRGGWHWQKVLLKGYNIRIQEPTKNKQGLMAIICPKQYSQNPTECFDKMTEEARIIGYNLAEKYNMKLGDFRTIRQGHNELVGSNKIAEYLGYLKAGNVWIDASGGSMNFEETEGTNKIEQLMNLPNRIEKLESVLEKMIQIQDRHVESEKWLTENIILHKQVLEEIRDAIRELRDKQ